MVLMRNIHIPENGEWVRRDVLVSNGRYHKVEKANSIPDIKNVRVIQGRGNDGERFVVPGAVDPHVHVREPGYSYKEDWETCTKSALRGGFTMIFDMPNNKNPIIDTSSLAEKKRIAAEKSLVDFGVYIALTEENAGSIGELSSSADVCGIKIYAAHTTGNILVESQEAFVKAFGQSKPVLVHTGGAEILQKILAAYERAHNLHGIPPVLYLCHTSTAEEVRIIRRWKKHFASIIAEVTPHHLFLNENNYTGFKRVLPPLGKKNDNEALIDAVEDGTIDILGTDHAPHTIEEKKKEKPPAGFPGLETALPLIFTAQTDGLLSLASVLKMTSETAIRLFRPDICVAVRPGCTASCTILEEGEYTIGESGYSTKCNWSPFHGWKIRMRPVATMLRGHIAYDDNGFQKYPVRYLCS
jgi:dihydroorotase